MKKLLSYILVLLFLSLNVNSIGLYDNTIHYWTLDNLTDIKGGATLNLYNSPTNTTGKIGGAYTVSGSGTGSAGGNQLYSNSLNESQLQYNSNYCLSFWSNYGAKKVGGYSMWTLGNASQTALSSEYTGVAVANNIYYASSNFATTAEYLGTNDANFQHYIFCQDGTNSRVYTYENNVLKLNESKTFTNTTKGALYLSFPSGMLRTFGSDGSHIFDEFAIFNKVLNSSDRSSLYNGGAGCTYSNTSCFGSFSTTPASLTFTNISLTNNTYFNSSSIQINTTVLNTSTNGNVSQYYTILNSSQVNYTRNDGNVTNVTIVSNDLIFNGNNSFIDLAGLESSLISSNNSISTSMWVYVNNLTSNQVIIGGANGSPTNRYYISIQSSGSLKTGMYNGTNWISAKSGTVSLGWNYITSTYNSNTQNISLYINNVLQTGTSSPLNSGNTGFKIGRATSSQYWFNGSMNGITIYNKVLNSSEITDIYNAGKDAFSPIRTNLVVEYSGRVFNGTTIAPNKIYDTSRFVNICNNCLSTQANISNLSQDVYKIFFYAQNNETNVFSSNYTFTVDTTVPTISNNILSEYTSYINNNLNSSCSDTNLRSCNISMNSQNRNLSNLFNFTLNGNQTYNITAIDLAGNTIIATGLTLVNPFQYFYFSNSTATITNFTFGGNTYTNYAAIPTYNSIISLGSNSLLFEKLGYSSSYVNFTVNTSSAINLTTNITQSKIIVSVYDRTTGALLTGTTTIEIIATTGFNTTTTTGQVNISDINFINELYTIQARNSAYNPEYIYFNYDNQQNLPVNLYLIATNLTNAGVVTVQLITDSGQRVNSAICSLLEWKASDSAYVSVAQGQTNINGEYVFNIEVGTKFYKITCTKAGETAISNAQIFTTSGYTLPLQIGAAFSSPTSLFQTISYSMNNISYNSTHDIIYLNASDSNGLISQICLNVYETGGINPTLLNPNNCSFSSTVNNKYVIVQRTNLTDSLIVKAEVVLGGVTYTLDSITYLSDNSIAKALDDYHLDILLPLTFVLIGIILGLSLKPANVFISSIGSIVMVWFSVMIVPSIVSTSIAIFITLISIMIIWGGSKPK